MHEAADQERTASLPEESVTCQPCRVMSAPRLADTIPTRVFCMCRGRLCTYFSCPHGGVAPYIASRVHVLAVHPDRPLCCSPIVSPPRTLVPWNNANNHHPPLHHCSRCERNERALSLRRYTQTHSPVCQTAWQKPYNYPITC